jgi:hypothetical protein
MPVTTSHAQLLEAGKHASLVVSTPWPRQHCMMVLILRGLFLQPRISVVPSTLTHRFTHASMFNTSPQTYTLGRRENNGPGERFANLLYPGVQNSGAI